MTVDALRQTQGLLDGWPPLSQCPRGRNGLESFQTLQQVFSVGVFRLFATAPVEVNGNTVCCWVSKFDRNATRERGRTS